MWPPACSARPAQGRYSASFSPEQHAKGASVGTSLLLFAYAAGAATSLALAILVGGRVFAAMKQSLGTGEWIRRGLGAAVLAAVGAIARGLDTGLLTRLSLASTAALEERLMSALGAAQPAAMREGRRSALGAAERGGMSGGPAVMQGGPAMMEGAPAMAGGPAMMQGGAAMMAAKPNISGTGELPVEGGMQPLSGAVEWPRSR